MSLAICKSLLKVMVLELGEKRISLLGTRTSLVSSLCFPIKHWKCRLASTGAAEAQPSPQEGQCFCRDKYLGCDSLVLSSRHCSWSGLTWYCYKDCQYLRLQFQSSRSKCIFRWSIQRTRCSKLHIFQNLIFLLGSTCWLFSWDFSCFNKWHLPEEEDDSQQGFSPLSAGREEVLPVPVHPMTLQRLCSDCWRFSFCEVASWKVPLSVMELVRFRVEDFVTLTWLFFPNWQIVKLKITNTCSWMDTN